MANIASSLGTLSDTIPAVNKTEIWKFSGLHMHFETLLDLASAVAKERQNIVQGTPLWFQGQIFTVSGEPPGIHRVWSPSLQHARTVVIRPGLNHVLLTDSNLVSLTTGVPTTGGINGDIAIDWVANQVYAKSTVSWLTTPIIEDIFVGPLVYDPPTTNPNNVPVVFTDVASTIAVSMPIAKTFNAGVYHYNVNINSESRVVSISAWGPGATGLVGGY